MASQPHAETARAKESSSKSKKARVSTPVAAGPEAVSQVAIEAALDDPLSATPQAILQLQRTAGNKAVERLLVQRRLQAKLSVGPAGDQYEQEADRVASKVMNSVQSAPPNQTQREEYLEDEGDGLQRFPAALPISRVRRQSAPADTRAEGAQPSDPRAGFDAGRDVEDSLASNRGGGKPLAADTRGFMESRFGYDFGGVRVHTGPESSQLNRQLSAQAFTHGSDIYFDDGKYNPGTSGGKSLLAHELTHVVQQGGSRAVAARRLAPVRRKFGAPPGLVQRFLTVESTRAFDTAGKANAEYQNGRRLVDKYAKPVKEPQSGDPAPWQTGVLTEMDDDNVTADEQNTINKMRRTHGLKFWQKSDEQEKMLKDFARAFMLWDFASRTNQLRPDDTAKYGKEPPDKKLAKRKAYMKHAQPFQEKFKGLVALGPSAPETQAFLKQEGFLSSMALTDKQQDKTKAIGPRIDVRATFIGGPILGINLRAHLFIVYTGRDGKQFYFRGGPGENLDPNDPTENGYTTVDYGEYSADTIDYDPSAPSVTVMSGDEAEGKLDAMIEASKAVNSMRVPYRAQVESKFAQKFKPGMLRTALGIFGTKGENCNRAAWTVLVRAGVPTNKPFGKHPGWGAILGADTPGKENAMPAEEKDDPKAAKKITLDRRRDIVGEDGSVQVYVDRNMYQKAVTLPVGTQVEQLGEDMNTRKISYGDGKIGYIVKRDKDRVRTARQLFKSALIQKNWYSKAEIKNIIEEIEDDQNYGRLLQLLSLAGLDRDFDSMRLGFQLLDNLRQDFKSTAENRFADQLANMSEAEVRDLKHNFDEMWAMINDTGVETEEAIRQVEARIGAYDRRDKVLRVIGEHQPHPVQINMWINHYPDYENVKELVSESGEPEDYVRAVLDSLRPEDVRGKFIEALFGAAKTFEDVENIISDEDEFAAYNDQAAEYLGVPREFVLARFRDYLKAMEELERKQELERQEEERRKEAEELLKAGKRKYKTSDYKAGKYELPVTEVTVVKGSDMADGPLTTELTIDPSNGKAWLVVLDALTEDFGRCQIRHNGRQIYVDLAAVFGEPDKKDDEELDDEDDSLEENTKELAEESGPGVVGVLAASDDVPVTMYQSQMMVEEIATYESPVRMRVKDPNYKALSVELVEVKDLDNDRTGVIYADILQNHFEPAPTEDEVEPEGGSEDYELEEVHDDEDDDVPASSEPGITEEDVSNAMKRLIDVFKGDYNGFALDTILNLPDTYWIDPALRLVLSPDFPGREERAEQLDMALGDSMTDDKMFITLFGKKA